MVDLFISQPMAGKSDEDILNNREEYFSIAVSILVSQGVNKDEIRLIDSFHTLSDNPIESLAKSINDLSKADVVYFAEGWSNSRGCKVEYIIATEYGIDIIKETV